MSEDIVCAAVVKFTDGTQTAMLLHRGSLKDCESVASVIPAISVSDQRPVESARIAFMLGTDWDNL